METVRHRRKRRRKTRKDTDRLTCGDSLFWADAGDDQQDTASARRLVVTALNAATAYHRVHRNADFDHPDQFGMPTQGLENGSTAERHE